MHKEHLARDDQREVTDAVICSTKDQHTYIFYARLARWCRQLATLCVSVDDSRPLRSANSYVQSVSLCDLCLYSLSYLVCEQECANSMASWLSTSTYHDCWQWG